MNIIKLLLQVEKAEAALLSIKRLFDKDEAAVDSDGIVHLLIDFIFCLFKILRNSQKSSTLPYLITIQVLLTANA